jgi:xylulokinase
VRLGGGGARSALWRQIQADVYGYDIDIVEAEEGAAFGAAILAGVGAGAWSSVEDACAAIVKVASSVKPTIDGSAVMRERYEAYRRVYPALVTISQAGA